MARSQKTTRRRFVVEGSGNFPIDMLRYDACWPEHESPDSYLISVCGCAPNDYGRRKVTLLTDNSNAPTYRRWDSHTWKVVSVEDVR